MTFVTVSVNRDQLALLSQLLVTLFPGCTVHQSCDPMRAIQRLSFQKVDAVIADADTVSNMMNLLDRQKSQAQIWLICGQGVDLPEKIADFCGILPYPITGHEMQHALQRIQCGV